MDTEKVHIVDKLTSLTAALRVRGSNILVRESLLPKLIYSIVNK